MQAVPKPSVAEVQANATFDALLWALSRPGVPRMLPVPGEAAVVGALLDRECNVYAEEPGLIDDIGRTGAHLTSLARADHIFLGALETVAPLSEIAVGSDLYPDDGATLVLRATLGEGAPVRLKGPGVDGAIDLKLGGLPDGFWTARAARIRYPMGFDLFLMDGDQVVGLPRSTVVESL